VLDADLVERLAAALMDEGKGRTRLGMSLSQEGIYKGRSPLFDNGGYTRGSPLVRTKASGTSITVR
jgi:hypothetical protein